MNAIESLGDRTRTLEVAEQQQAGNGAPAHFAMDGTEYWDYTNSDLYINDSGLATYGNSWQLIGGGGGPGFPHSILSATHVDTTPAVVVRGDVMTGQGVVPTWQRLAHPGVATRFLTSGANEPTWTAITALGGVPALTYGLVDAAGVATTFVQTDASLAIFDAVVPNTIQCDDAAATGAQPFAARRDHEHAIVCAVAVNIANANAEGVATSFSRSDHVHNHPAGLGVNLHHNEVHTVNSTGPHAEAGLTIGHVLRASGAAAFSFAAIQAGDLPGLGGVPALTLGLVNAAGAAATYVQTDASIAIFDAVVPTTIQCDDAAATGVVAFAARRDHTHGMPTVAPVNIGVANAEGTAYDFVRSDHVHNHPAGLGANLHHNEIHVVNSTGPHAEAGLTIGHMLRVSGAAAFSFAAIQNADVPAALDVNPGTCTVATGNVAATPHTHAITTSPNPGPAASILATGGAGALTLTGVFTAIGGVVLDDGAGNSPDLDFVGGSNDDTATLLLADNAVAGRSDLVLVLCDAAGRSQFQIYSSTPALVAYIDSTGLAALAGLGIGAVPVAGGIVVTDGTWQGIGAALERLEFNAAGNIAVLGAYFEVVGSLGSILLGPNTWGNYIEFTRDGANYIQASGASSLLYLGAGGNNDDLQIQADHDVIVANGSFGVGTTSPDRLLHAEASDAATAAVTYAQRLTHVLSAGAAADGIGVGIEFECEYTAALGLIGYLFFNWIDADPAANRVAQYCMDFICGGNRIEYLRLTGGDGGSSSGNPRGDWSVEVGGRRSLVTHAATGDYSVLVGGYENTASGQYSCTLGGWSNLASGTYALTAGYDAHATHSNSMVFSAAGAQTLSWAANTWTVRCHGGARFYSAAGVGTGVQMAAGGNAWAAISDRRMKENFRVPEDILGKLATLPIYNYNLKSQPETIRHVSPMAQDFNSLFGFTEDELRINMLDISGIALIAVQALLQRVESLEEELRRRDGENV